MAIEPIYDDRGLVPCVVQHARSGRVLMMAWMNSEAVALTRQSGVAHFWSRSRHQLWRKGDTSGNTLAVVEMRVDCDRDCVLLRVDPAGPACHTGAASCFFDRDDGERDDGPPGSVLDALDRVLAARRDQANAERSYTRSLLDGGWPRMLAKIAEEHGELAAELASGSDAAVVHEAADLLFHVMVGLTARKISVSVVLDELARRLGISGHDEKAARTR